MTLSSGGELTGYSMFISLFVLPRSLYSHCHGLPKDTITEFETALKTQQLFRLACVTGQRKKKSHKLLVGSDRGYNDNSKFMQILTANKVETPLLHHAIDCCSISCLKKIKPKKILKRAKRI